MSDTIKQYRREYLIVSIPFSKSGTFQVEYKRIVHNISFVNGRLRVKLCDICK